MINPHDAAVEAAADALTDWTLDPEIRRRMAEAAVNAYLVGVFTIDAAEDLMPDGRPYLDSTAVIATDST